MTPTEEVSISTTAERKIIVSSEGVAPDKDWVIVTRGIKREYDMGGEVIRALRGVDIAIRRNEYVAIMGPSGSGKSTLMNMIGCLDTPSAGEYWLNGLLVSTMGDDELARVRNKEIGFVFQTFNLLGHRTVLDNVMLAEVYLGRSREGREERAMAALERVGIEQRADFLPVKLSGGQQQRVAIARALVGAPSLLLCDEPTGNLDSVNTATVLALVDELVDDGMTMLLITHDENVAERMPRRTAIIDGQLTEHT